MKLIYLDVDGVLNTHEWDKEVGCGQIHPDKMHRLNVLLKKTGACIILSSAWRYLILRGEMDLTGLNWLFRSHGLINNRLIGITRGDTMRKVEGYDGDPKSWPVTNERGLQIHEHVDSFTLKYGKLESFVVIDDLDLGISDHKLPFIQTDGNVGLTDDHVTRGIRILNDTSKR